LISAKSHDSMNSTFGNEPSAEAQTFTLFLHDEDARARGIGNGDRVRVFNSRGSCTLVAGVNGVVRPGVVLAPSVRWNKLAPDHRNINVLTSDRLTDIGGGPTFYSCLVDVEKCGD
jgi:anaerobic selenocysteine-containing dehydrogenase